MAVETGFQAAMPRHLCLLTTDCKRRVRKNDPELKELAESIRRYGVIEPLIGRPHPTQEDHVEIRAGKRRYVASELAGLETIPVIVRDLDDETAFGITLAENHDRDDLTLIEEAETVQEALSRGMTHEQIGKLIGWDRMKVARRAKLINLSPRWKKAVDNPETPVSRWPASHLELVSRFPHEIQDHYMELENFDDSDSFAFAEQAILDIHDVRRDLARYTHDLSLAPWDLDDGALVKKSGPCSRCPKRSDHEPDLWDTDEVNATVYDIKGGRCEAICLDTDCWQAKLQAHVERQHAELKKKHENLETVGSLDRHAYERSTKKARGSVPVLVADGPDAGDFFWGKPKPGAKAGGNGNGSGGPGRPAGSGLSLEEKKARVDRKRAIVVVEDLVETIQRNRMGNSLPPLTDISDESEAAFKREDIHRLALALSFGIPDPQASINDEKDWDDFHSRCTANFEVSELAEDFYYRAADRMCDELAGQMQLFEMGRGELDSVQRVADLFRIDLAGSWEKARKEHPYPKSWGLNPDGTEQEKKKPGRPKKEEAAAANG